MSEIYENSNNQSTSNSVFQIIGRFIVAMIILSITAFFTPGFNISNLWTLAISAVTLTAIDYILVKITGLHASPFGKGFVGFALSAILLYVTQFFIVGYSISWIAAIVGAFIYGIFDYFIPGNEEI